MRNAFGLAVLATLVAFVSAQSPKPNPATVPAPRDKGWTARHEKFVEIAKKGDVDVLFLGDSITDAWGGEGHGKGPGAEIFENEFKAMKAAISVLVATAPSMCSGVCKTVNSTPSSPRL